MRGHLPDYHEMALDRAMKMFAEHHGIDITEMEKKYSERELLKEAGEKLWEMGLAEYATYQVSGDLFGAKEKKAKQAIREIKADEKWAKEEMYRNPFAKHLRRFGIAYLAGGVLPLVISGHMDEVQKVFAAIGAISYTGWKIAKVQPPWQSHLQYYAERNFRYHVKNSKPESVVRTYLALKAVHRKQIPGSIASKIGRIYTVKKAVEEYLKEANAHA